MIQRKWQNQLSIVKVMKHWVHHAPKTAKFLGLMLICTFLLSTTTNGQSLVQLISATNPLLGMNASTLNSNIRFVDIDGDGDLDGYVGQANGGIEFYENLGSRTVPAFSNSGYLTITSINANSTVAFADLDNDGDYDLTVGDEGGTLEFYENTGTALVASFTLAVTNPFGGVNEGNYSNVEFVDADCDGDLDAFIGQLSGEVSYYKNIGNASTPNFLKQLGGANPFNGIDVGTRSYLTLKDLDGDADYDALIGTGEGTIKVFENIGTPTNPEYSEFKTGSDAFALGYGANAAPEFADTDGDGDFDLYVGEDGGGFEYYQNIYSFACGAYDQQTGGSNPLDNMSGTTISSSSTAFCDVDGDGDQDVIVGSLNLGLFYYENVGTPAAPSFSYVGGTLDAASPFFEMIFDQTSMPTTVDIDGDGDCDIFVGQTDGTIQYIRNNGSGSFTMMGVAGNPLGTIDVGNRSAPAFGDIDGDGDMDAFIGEQNGTLLYYLNTGDIQNPSFSNVNGNANPLNLVSVFQNATPVLVDYDKDGDLDAFVGRFNGTVRLYQNQGNSNTPFFASIIGSDNPFDGISVNSNPNLSFTDLDKDGSSDVFIGGNDGNTYYFLGGACAVLPVELAYFNAYKEDETVFLDWMTATEINNEGFTIERSSDGKTWETLDFVQGAGSTNEPQHYEYTDFNPLAGTNFYRLKQKDFDGEIAYSSIRVVEFETKAIAIEVFPNPVANYLNINLDTQLQATVFISNISGQLIREVTLTDINNQINLTDLDGGLYIIRIIGEGINASHKIIKH